MVSTSTLYFIFSYFWTLFFKVVFLCSLPIFWLWSVTIYIFGLPFRCTVLLTITRKRLTSVVLFSLPSSHVRLSSIFCRSSLWVLSCVVVSHGVVGCWGQYWLLLFFLRVWLMLGTTFPCRWLAVDSPWSSWFSRSGFCWSNFYVLFHCSRTAPQLVDFFSLPFFVCSLILLYISSLLQGLGVYNWSRKPNI